MTDEPQSSERSPKELDIDPLEDLEEAARSVIQTIRRVSSRILVFSLLSYVVAAGVGIVGVFLNPVRDPFFFVAMYIVLFVYILSYIKAHQRGARIRSIVTLTIAEILMMFWVYILVDRIPERIVFISDGNAISTGQIIEREPLTILWFSVGALCTAALGLLFHWLWVGRLQRSLR